jgi:hypothetical protein
MSQMTWGDFRDVIVSNLSDDLLVPKYRRMKKTTNVPNTFGHCYVASEAAYYLLGGKEEGWKAMHMTHLGASHWFLLHDSGKVLDITANQFSVLPDYNKARGTGFLTKNPSKRAKKLIIRIRESRHWNELKKSRSP